jgi:hypothetical protein
VSGRRTTLVHSPVVLNNNRRALGTGSFSCAKSPAPATPRIVHYADHEDIDDPAKLRRGLLGEPAQLDDPAAKAFQRFNLNPTWVSGPRT